jgi:hypothetical protein
VPRGGTVVVGANAKRNGFVSTKVKYLSLEEEEKDED